MASPLKARVKNGRLVLDEPTDLPDGTVIELQEADPYRHLDSAEADKLDEAQRKELEGSLRRGLDHIKTGNTRPAEELIAELRRRG